MDVIVSSANALYKQLHKLTESARERRQQGVAWLDGEHLLEMALQAEFSIERLLLAENAFDGLGSRWRERLPAVPANCFSDSLFRQLAPVETPSGIAALVRIDPSHEIQGRDFWVLLENLQDPGNLGTILRTAAAAGVTDVWLSRGCVDAWSPKVLRAGMGAHFLLTLHAGVELPQVIRQFPGKTLAATLDGSDDLFAADLTGPCAFVFGNEGAGLTAELSGLAKWRVRIPMPGKMESLNAAAAAAICLYEHVRQDALAKTEHSLSGLSK